MAVSVGAGGFAAALASWPLVGFFFGSLLRKYSPVWEDVGPLERFKVGATVQVNLEASNRLPWGAPAGRVAAWLRRNNEQNFTCFNSKCTHLGCPVRWIPSAELFMCPCHGGVYYKDGDVAAGPPPDALEHFASRVRNGRVEVQWRFEQVDYAKAQSPCEGCGGKPAMKSEEV